MGNRLSLIPGDKVTLREESTRVLLSHNLSIKILDDMIYFQMDEVSDDHDSKDEEEDISTYEEEFLKIEMDYSTIWKVIKCDFKSNRAILRLFQLNDRDNPNLSLFTPRDVEYKLKGKNQDISVPTDYIQVVEDYQAKIRRETFRLYNSYESSCENNNVEPIEVIKDMYSKGMELGEKVKCLNLSNLQISNADIYPLTYLLTNKSSLLKLSIDNNRLTSEGLPSLCKILKYNYSQLTELNLAYNPLGKAGAETLAPAITSCNHLLVLNLEGCQLTTEGSKLLIQSIIPSNGSKSRLVKLNLKFDGVENECIHELLQLAQETHYLCFLELYPPAIDHQNNSPWLSMSGWHNHSKLRDAISENINYCRLHPEVFELPSKSSVTNFFDYLNDRIQNANVVEKNKTHHDHIQKEQSTSVDRLSGEWVVCTRPSNPKINSLALSKEGSGDPNVSIDEDLFSLRSLRYRDRSSKSYEALELMNTNIENAQNSTINMGNSMECGICFEDDLKPEEMYIIDECLHKFCLNCMKMYVSNKIQSAETDAIRCPECNRTMKVPEIIQLIHLCNNQSLMEKFEKFSLTKALSNMENLIHCPNSQCNNAMIVPADSSPQNGSTTDSSTLSQPVFDSNYHPRYTQHQYEYEVSLPNDNSTLVQLDSDEEEIKNPPRIVTCTECSSRICSSCGLFEHTNITCEKAIASSKDSSYEDAKKEFGIKSCPGCQADTQQNNGCNHMTCVRCGTNWCWNCQANLGKGKDYQAHFSVTTFFGGCPKWYYSNLLPSRNRNIVQ